MQKKILDGCFLRGAIALYVIITNRQHTTEIKVPTTCMSALKSSSLNGFIARVGARVGRDVLADDAAIEDDATAGCEDAAHSGRSSLPVRTPSEDMIAPATLLR